MCYLQVHKFAAAIFISRNEMYEKVGFPLRIIIMSFEIQLKQKTKLI